MESLLTTSENYKRDATALLEKTALIRLLRKYGRVQLIGGYALDLLVSPDIDITVVDSRMTRAKALRLFDAIVKQGRFEGHMFNDNVKRRDARFPRGYYIGLKRPYADKRWKIDVWCLTSKNREGDRVMRYVGSRLTRANRLAILKLKAYKYRRGLGFPSTVIYDAVLADGVTSIRDLKAFLKSSRKS